MGLTCSQEDTAKGRRFPISDKYELCFGQKENDKSWKDFWATIGGTLGGWQALLTGRISGVGIMKPAALFAHIFKKVLPNLFLVGRLESAEAS